MAESYADAHPEFVRFLEGYIAELKALIATLPKTPEYDRWREKKQ